MAKEPITVVITGAAGQIGYSLIYMVSSGYVFGPDQPLVLHLLDIAPMMGVLEGVVMEIDDCALPLVTKVVATAEPEVAFKVGNLYCPKSGAYVKNCSLKFPECRCSFYGWGHATQARHGEEGLVGSQRHHFQGPRRSIGQICQEECESLGCRKSSQHQRNNNAVLRS